MLAIQNFMTGKLANRPFVLALVFLVLAVLGTLLVSPLIYVIYKLWIYILEALAVQHFDDTIAFIRGTFPYVYVGIVAIFATLFAITASSTISRQNQRRQDTIKILIDTRFSPEYAKWIVQRKKDFPVNQKASAEKFFELKMKNDEGAQAIVMLLNYHEFIAAGVIEENLDESMLETTISGILCRFVFEMRDIIREFRIDENQTGSLDNLVNAYWLWVNADSSEEYEKNIDLGREPTNERAKARKAKIIARN